MCYFGRPVDFPKDEIRKRTRFIGTFPDDKSALMLVMVRLKYMAERG